MKQTTIALLGYGRLGKAIATGITKHTPHRLQIASPNLNPGQHQHCLGFTQNIQAIAGAKIVLLAVKPQMMRSVLDEIQPHLVTSQHTVISMAAGVSLAQIHERLPTQDGNLLRAMPNIMISDAQSTTALCAPPKLCKRSKIQAESLFTQLGSAWWLADERGMALATALIGSGPAFIFYFVEAMTSAAASLGWPQAATPSLVRQLFRACSYQLQSDDPIALIQQIASEGGTTAAGLSALTQGQLHELIESALSAAMEKAKALQQCC